MKFKLNINYASLYDGYEQPYTFQDNVVFKESIDNIPNRSSLNALMFLKKATYLLSIFFTFSLLVSFSCIYMILKTNISFLSDSYVGDASFILLLFSIFLGTILLILYVIFFFTSILNCRKWLRKTYSYLWMLIIIFFLFCISFFCLFLCKGILLDYTSEPIVTYLPIKDNLNLYLFNHWSTLTFISDQDIKILLTKYLDSVFIVITISTIILFLITKLLTKRIKKTLSSAEFYFYRQTELAKL